MQFTKFRIILRRRERGGERERERERERDREREMNWSRNAYLRPLYVNIGVFTVSYSNFITLSYT